MLCMFYVVVKESVGLFLVSSTLCVIINYNFISQWNNKSLCGWKMLIQLLCISETLSVYRCYGETMTGRNKELMCYTVYQVKCSRSANNRRMWYSVKHIIRPPRGIAVTVKSALCEFKPCWDPWLNWSLKIVVLNQMTWFVLLPWPHCTSCLFVITVRLKSFKGVTEIPVSGLNWYLKHK